MQTQPRRRGGLRARRPPPLASGGGGTSAQAEESAAAVTCRICWTEADSDEGGVLLSPCRCTGSQRYVHQRCLAAWMASVAERRGVHAACRCSVCQARYVGLPRELRMREAPAQYLRRHAEALLASRAGVACSYYGAAGLLFAVATALHGAFTSVRRVHGLMVLTMTDPLEAARQMLPFVPPSVATEALVSGDWQLPLLAVGRALQGMAVFYGGCQAEAAVMARWATLSPPMAVLAASAALAIKYTGALVEWINLSLLLLFGGMGLGFVRGLGSAAVAPFHWAAKAATAMGHAAVAAGSLLAGRGRRRPRKCSGQGEPAAGGQQAGQQAGAAEPLQQQGRRRRRPSERQVAQQHVPAA